MSKLYNLAKMTTATIGTGTITLGSADNGYLTFAQAGVQDGDVVSYGIQEGNDTEVGRGTYHTSGTTLSRDVILKSTNSNTAIVLGGGALVYITALAEDILNKTGDTMPGALALSSSLSVIGHSIMGNQISIIDPQFVLAISEHMVPSGSQNIAAICVTSTVNTAFAAGSVTGGIFESGFNTTGTAAFIAGASGASYLNSAGTITLAMGGQFLCQNTNAGTINVGKGIQVQLLATGNSGAITFGYGVHIQAPVLTNSSTMGTLYGLKIDDHAAVGTVANYAIYTGTGTVRIGGTVLLPTLTASLPVFTDANSNLTTNAVTGSVNVVMSASPTLTGTLTAATANFSGIVSVTVPAGSFFITNLNAVQSGSGNSLAGGFITFKGGSAGATERGRIGFTKTTAGTATIFSAELIDSIGIRSAGSMHLGSGGDAIRMTILSTGSVGIGSLAPTGVFYVAPAMTIASGASAIFDAVSVSAGTATISGNTNITTATGFNMVNFGQPTLSAASALTITNAATIYISNSPVGGGAGPATITNAYSLWIDAGNFRLDGNLDLSGASGGNIVTDTTTGTKIGTLGGASGQKLGFFNQTPIVQPLLATGTSKTVDNVITVLQNLGLVRQS